MKQLVYIVMVFLLTVSCARQQDNITSAAMDIYSQYNNHSETLTVAFVGDYNKGGEVYNAVMFQTADSAEWEWLKDEFGVFSMDEVRASRSASALVTAPKDADTSTSGASSCQEEEHEVIMGTLEVDTTRDFKDTAEFLAYIDSLAFELLRQTYGDSIARLRMRPVKIMDLDSMPDDLSAQKVSAHRKINKFTREHGRISYLVNVDYDNQTLWLFFYEGEC